MPSYTHLRRAQPILAAHFFLAHAAAFRRDVGRFERVMDDADEMPLGSGAIAGTTYAVDTLFLARRLGFSRTVLNSLDASSDRDFVASFLYACSLAMVHLSRLAEDVIIFTSEEFGFFELPGPVRHRQQPDAPEEEPRPAGARAREVRPRARAPRRVARDDEGPARRLQPGPPGGQGSGVRNRGHTGFVARRLRGRCRGPHAERRAGGGGGIRPSAGHRRCRLPRGAGSGVPRRPRDCRCDRAEARGGRARLRVAHASTSGARSATASAPTWRRPYRRRRRWRRSARRSRRTPMPCAPRSKS